MDGGSNDDSGQRIYKIITGKDEDLVDDNSSDAVEPSVCQDCKSKPPISQNEILKDLCVQCLVSRYGGDVGDAGEGMDNDFTSESCVNGINDGENHGEDYLNDDGADLDSKSANQFSLEKERQYKMFLDKAKYIPLRLTMEERKKLRILEAALNVSEYTDKVDVYSTQRTKRMINQIREICSIIAGLIVATDYNLGQKLFQNKDYAENIELYREMFELGRRYKIMNPDKMRSSYGKLMYLLQDSMNPQVNSILNFDLDCPIRTVYRTLEEINCLNMLSDPILNVATAEVIPEGKSKSAIRECIRAKERAVEHLVKKYSPKDDKNAQDLLRSCIYSMSDYNAYVRANSGLCSKVIEYLKEYFGRDSVQLDRTLSITAGLNGSRLTHDHNKQYTYVLQSLTLWKEILSDIHKLWFLVDRDMLSYSNNHKLYNTGQGLNRVQPAPETLKHMHVVLDRTRKQIGSWVGSTVIHLGDHNVPNALMFIDKYAQVHRILSPIVNVVNYIREMPWKNTDVEHYFQKLGGPQNVCISILSDFFCSAFDGSGATNYYDAGSCIDGRLTSTWNWCSMVHRKSYYPVFLLSGFIGFDGDWAS